ncbi:MAG: DinB family protein [Alphaproteobacteria bacterium]
MDIIYFQALAAYNRWANRRLYNAVAALRPGEFEQDRPAFFRSIKGTLNHILIGDRVWLGHLQGTKSGIDRLNAILYDDLAALHAAREAEDERIERLFATFDNATLARSLTYTTISAPRTFTTPMPFVFGHFFNHQTHHRGQVHDMLSQTAVEPPVLDFLYFVNTRR